MFPSGPLQCLCRPSLRFISSSNRLPSSLALFAKYSTSHSYTLSLSRPRTVALVLRPPLQIRLRRDASTQPGNSLDHVNKAQEKAIGKEQLQPHPEEVTTVSIANRPFYQRGDVSKEAEEAEEEEEEDIDMFADVKSDFKAIKETFAFGEVPKAALVMGLAGVVPYAVTSLTTLYLAWDVNHYGLLVSDQTAELLLHIIEPIQIGYGAVIISFLGAIHWGFEWSKYGNQQHWGRYAIGAIAPAVAWPTLLLPIEYALIAQFSAFTFLYYADASAVTQGWAPHWYSTYRFVLTFVVGASIVMSLAARGQMADKIHKMPTTAERVQALRESQREDLERQEFEERALRAAQADEEAEEEEEEEEEEEGGDGEEGGDDGDDE